MNIINLHPKRNYRRDCSVGFVFLLFIAGSTSLEFLKKAVLSHTSPIAFSAVTKVSMGLCYLTVVVLYTFKSDGVERLFEHSRQVGTCTLGTLITVLFILGAVTVALDNIAFVYLDLTTKKVIDSTFPFPLFLLSFPVSRILSTMEPVTYTMLAQTDDTVVGYSKPNQAKVMTVKGFLILCMVVSSAAVVWSAGALDSLGLLVNGISLFTSAVALLITETIVKWDIYSQFGMMLVTAIPEMLVLSASSYLIGEEMIHVDTIFFALLVGIIESILKAFAFYLLVRTSSVDLSIAGVVIFVCVVGIDTYRTASYGVNRLVSLSFVFVTLVLYTAVGMWWSEKEMALTIVSKTPTLHRLDRTPFDVFQGTGVFDDNALSNMRLESYEYSLDSADADETYSETES